MSAGVDSWTIVSSIGLDDTVHPDFGSGTWEGRPIGIPFDVVAPRYEERDEDGIGTVELVDCVRDSDSVWAEADHWHWLLRRPRPLRTPYPCAGRLGLWRPPEHVLGRLS